MTLPRLIRTKARCLVLFVLLAAFVVRIALTYHVFNDTVDEQIHIMAGLEYLQTGRYDLEVQHPPLARIAMATLPYLFTDLRYVRFRDRWGLWESVWGERGLAY